MAETELERIYTIPLRKVKASSRNGRADRAVREVRSFLERHMKSDDIWIDDAVNRAIWARGKFTVPSAVRVRAVKFDDGVVEVSLPEEEAMTSIRAQLKEEREAKVPALPTLPEGEAEGETGEIEAEPETGEIEAEPEEPRDQPGAAEPKGARAPKSVRKADQQAGGGAQQHEPADEKKVRDADKITETHD